MFYLTDIFGFNLQDGLTLFGAAHGWGRGGGGSGGGEAPFLKSVPHILQHSYTLPKEDPKIYE